MHTRLAIPIDAAVPYFTLLSLCFFPPPFNLFSKEVEVQRTGRLIKVDILALRLIAFYKQVGFWLTAEGRPVF